jgi:hypothetical protein
LSDKWGWVAAFPILPVRHAARLVFRAPREWRGWWHRYLPALMAKWPLRARARPASSVCKLINLRDGFWVVKPV